MEEFVPRFTSYFKIANSQASVDFLDVDLAKDNRFYIDPFAVQIKDDAWSVECGDLIRSFFSEVLVSLRDGNNRRALELLDHLHEPNETFLGQSVGKPSGRGVGKDKAAWLASAIKRSRAFETGILSDISEAAIYIKYVGADTISDLTTNILRGKLAEYTKDQCDLLGIETHAVGALPSTWDAVRQRWKVSTFQLPLYKGRPVLLCPKYSVRMRMSLDSQEFYNHYMLEALQAEHLNSGSSLVEVLRDGTRRVTKEELKKHHPFIKDELAEFVKNNPKVMETYKEIKGAKGAPEEKDLEYNFDAKSFLEALIGLLEQIPAGRAAANEYHELVIGILIYLFYPFLIYPIKEHPIHGGRKRIDIKFTNAGDSGFFFRALSMPQTRAVSVVVECKNYSEDVANEELDQLSGRFGHTRGFLGLSISRTFESRSKVIARCRDTALDQRGYVLPLCDRDLVEMLSAKGAGKESVIHRRLETIFAEVSG
jgi:ferritin-like protein